MNAPDKSVRAALYNNRELVPDHAQYFARWAEDSQRTRGTMTSHLDLRYGDAPGEAIDLFPARKGDGSCLMFIHGGYWRSLDKKDFSFLAPALVDGGISLAVVNYDLCPKISMEEIVRQMLRASRWLWLHAEDYGMDQDRLYVSGHSAGGHLTAMLMCAGWPAVHRQRPSRGARLRRRARARRRATRQGGGAVLRGARPHPLQPVPELHAGRCLSRLDLPRAAHGLVRVEGGAARGERARRGDPGAGRLRRRQEPSDHARADREDGHRSLRVPRLYRALPRRQMGESHAGVQPEPVHQAPRQAARIRRPRRLDLPSVR